ncbi:MAG: hypothetical protein U0X40_07420 [Ferruginibacter sp.]
MKRITACLLPLLFSLLLLFAAALGENSTPGKRDLISSCAYDPEELKSSFKKTE